jgi:dihydrofolate reductase
MAKTVLYMSMSLDGFITGPDDGVDHPLGRGGFRLHDWFNDGNGDPKSFRPSAQPSAQVFDELMDTAAVITGRRTFDLAHGWNGDHHDGVPVFVLTHTAPEGEPAGHVRYVTDLESCVTAAKTAAGDRNILVHGAYTAQRMLRAGLLDEMEIHLIPVLLGQGRRLFDADNPQNTELELVRALSAPGVMHLRYRVQQHS